MLFPPVACEIIFSNSSPNNRCPLNGRDVKDFFELISADQLFSHRVLRAATDRAEVRAVICDVSRVVSHK